MIKTKLIAAFLLLALSACHSLPDSAKPGGWILKHAPENAPEIVKKGWKDGCKTGLGSMSNSGYRTFFQYTQDPTLRRDPIYYKTWKDALTYCRHYVYGIVRQSNTRARLANNRSSFHERIAGAHNMLDYNFLNLWGPSDRSGGLMFENFGLIQGDPHPGNIGGTHMTWDMRGEVALGGMNGGEHMNWNFAPKQGIAY